MAEFKIYGQYLFDAAKEKEFPLAVQNKMLDEVAKVSNQVTEHLNKPSTDRPVHLSKLDKVFPSQLETTYKGRVMRAAHAARLQNRK